MPKELQMNVIKMCKKVAPYHNNKYSYFMVLCQSWLLFSMQEWIWEISWSAVSKPASWKVTNMDLEGQRFCHETVTSVPLTSQRLYLLRVLFSDAMPCQYIISSFTPLNAELNPICYLLALLPHHFLHVSRIRVKSLTIRLLMSYIYGAPILDVYRSHTTTQHSR